MLVGSGVWFAPEIQEAKTQVVQAARDPDLQLTAASVPWFFRRFFVCEKKNNRWKIIGYSPEIEHGT